MSAVLYLQAVDSYLGSTESSAEIGLSPNLGTLHRISGFTLLDLYPTGNTLFLYIGSVTFLTRLQFLAAAFDDQYYFGVSGPAGANPLNTANFDISLIDPDEFYIIRHWAGADLPSSGVQIWEDDWSAVLGEDIQPTQALSAPSSTRGHVHVGANIGLLTGGGGSRTGRGLRDGVAIYSGMPPTADPAAGQSGLIYYVPFKASEEGSATGAGAGLVATNEVAGQPSLNYPRASTVQIVAGNGARWGTLLPGGPEEIEAEGGGTLPAILGFGGVEQEVGAVGSGALPALEGGGTLVVGAGASSVVTLPALEGSGEVQQQVLAGGESELPALGGSGEIEVYPGWGGAFVLPALESEGGVEVQVLADGQGEIPALEGGGGALAIPDPVFGAAGDSNTAEFVAHQGIGQGTPYEAYHKNWLEQLAAYRGLDFGQWSDAGWGGVREEGYEYNWAVPGYNMAGLEGSQIRGDLEVQVQQGLVNRAIIQGTVNEIINGAHADLEEAYSSPDGVLGGITGTPIATLVANYVTPSILSINQLVAAGAVSVTFILPPNYLEYAPARAAPVEQPAYGYADGYMQAIYDQINAHVDAVNETLGRLVVNTVRWDKYYEQYWQTFDGTYVEFGPVLINVVASAPNAHPLYRSYAGHTGTIFNALSANAVIDALNEFTGINITPFSESEILLRAGVFIDPVEVWGGGVLPELQAQGFASGPEYVSAWGEGVLPELGAGGDVEVGVRAEGTATLPELDCGGVATTGQAAQAEATLPALQGAGSVVVAVEGGGVAVLPALHGSGRAVGAAEFAGTGVLPELQAVGRIVQGAVEPTVWGQVDVTLVLTRSVLLTMEL